MIKKEKRAIRLFEYIDECKKRENQERLAKLSLIITKQHKEVQEKTIKWNNKLEESKKSKEQSRRNAIKEVD